MNPIEVAPGSLSREALRALVEEFVTRDGTDYGAVERSLDAKVADVLRQLDRGEVRIVFDPDSETTTLVASSRRATRSGSGGPE
jgi:uncharacterized protein YheU (UPF0270 family)